MRIVAFIAAGLMVAMMLACGGAGSSTPTEDRSAIGSGFNRGENDLEGHTDSTPQEPIIDVAEKALKKYLKGKVEVSGTPTVKIIESEGSWAVSGRYESPIDKRHDFTSIVCLNSHGEYEAGCLMLDDDMVMDKVDKIVKSKSKRKPEPPATRTWTSTIGQFSVEASFMGHAGDKIKLRKTDGTIITVDAAKLSDSDRQWINDRSPK